MTWAAWHFLYVCGFSLLYGMLFNGKGEGQAQGGFILKFASSWKEAESFLLPDECILRVYHDVVQSWVGGGLETQGTWRKCMGCQAQKRNEDCTGAS